MALLATDLGLDMLLGAFSAGILARLAFSPEQREEIEPRLGAVRFGFVIPVFFVASGMRFDVDALLGATSVLALVPLSSRTSSRHPPRGLHAGRQIGQAGPDPNPRRHRRDSMPDHTTSIPVLLAVDDDADARARLVRELRRYEFDYEVVVIDSAEEALARLEELAADGRVIAIVLADSGCPVSPAPSFSRAVVSCTRGPSEASSSTSARGVTRRPRPRFAGRWQWATSTTTC